jgi:hypothetical protein
VVTLAAALALAVPPRATLDTGAARVPLAISSWCWGSRCGAPITRSAKPVPAARGALVTVELAFTPRSVHAAVGGAPVAVPAHGREVSWRARTGGGLTLTATGGRGWVTYVARLALR